MGDESDLRKLATKIRRAHKRAEQTSRKSLEAIREAGQALIEAKQQIGHGGWLDWVHDNCRIQDRQARAYMQIARHWDGIKSASNADMTLSAALASLRPSKSGKPKPRLKRTDTEAILAALNVANESDALNAIEKWALDHPESLQRLERLIDTIRRPLCNTVG